MFLLRLVIFSQGLMCLKGLSWPDGTYGLPQSLSGCPDGDGLKWETGWRRQHLEKKTPVGLDKILKSPHLNASLALNGSGIERSFCIKTISETDDTNTSWPAGKYCIYKYGDFCPEGMKTGFVHWDDIDDTNNKNGHGGVLPEGSYDNDTRLEYCCQDNGDRDDPIELPVDRPFFLLPYKLAVCQHVKWAQRILESIVYDTEDRKNGDLSNGHHGYVKQTNSSITAFYCYYKACRSTFHDITGYFKTSNNNHQYCSWSIAVRETLVISLNFSQLNIPDCQLNYLDIYDGFDQNGKLLRRYCGSNATQQVKLISTRNVLFVMLKAGGNYDGVEIKHVQFEAKYKAKINSKHCHETLLENRDNGSFMSPMYPAESYPANQNCSWNITVEEFHLISLIFDYFNLPNCKDNYISIFDGSSTKSPLLKKLCQSKMALTTAWNSTGNSMFIVYKSGRDLGKEKQNIIGFSARYKTLRKRSLTTQNLEALPTQYSSAKYLHKPSGVETTVNRDKLPKVQSNSNQHKNSSNSSQVTIILTATLISLLALLLIILVLLFRRRLTNMSIFNRFKPMRINRKESGNPLYEQSSRSSNSNPLYSSSAVALYEDVKMRKDFLPRIREDHSNSSVSPKSDDVVERHYDTPKLECPEDQQEINV